MTRIMLDREAELRHLQHSMERHTAVAVFAAAERFVRLSTTGDPDAATASNQAFLRSVGKPMAVDTEYQGLIDRMRDAGSDECVAFEAKDTLRAVSKVDVS